jgi:ankyrin repeat protein
MKCITIITINNIHITGFITNGSTPLHLACYNGHIDIVNILLKYNSSVNLCATDGSTPLHVACIKGYKDIVDIFIFFISITSNN